MDQAPISKSPNDGNCAEQHAGCAASGMVYAQPQQVAWLGTAEGELSLAATGGPTGVAQMLLPARQPSQEHTEVYMPNVVNTTLHPTGKSGLPGPYFKHRSKQQVVTTLNPHTTFHIPRTFLALYYDLETVLRDGLDLQIDADGTMDPEIVHVSVANHQNRNGYSYHRLLGFRPTCRKYEGWSVEGWQAMDTSTVRMFINKPSADATPGASVGSTDMHTLPVGPTSLVQGVPMAAGGNSSTGMHSVPQLSGQQHQPAAPCLYPAPVHLHQSQGQQQTVLHVTTSAAPGVSRQAAFQPPPLLQQQHGAHQVVPPESTILKQLCANILQAQNDVDTTALTPAQPVSSHRAEQFVLVQGPEGLIAVPIHQLTQPISIQSSASASASSASLGVHASSVHQPFPAVYAAPPPLQLAGATATPAQAPAQHWQPVGPLHVQVVSTSPNSVTYRVLDA